MSFIACSSIQEQYFHLAVALSQIMFRCLLTIYMPKGCPQSKMNFGLRASLLFVAMIWLLPGHSKPVAARLYDYALVLKRDSEPFSSLDTVSSLPDRFTSLR